VVAPHNRVRVGVGDSSPARLEEEVAGGGGRTTALAVGHGQGWRGDQTVEGHMATRERGRTLGQPF
jgi:hypothetical protein